MGCFLGCFGFSSKRKPRKPANRIQPGDQKLGRYEPLDSASANLDIKELPTHLDLELRKGNKETLRLKIRKKVSFNLNVQTYEPIPKEDDYEEEHEEETSKQVQSYPPDYRYRSYVDSQDEEDEMAYGESDLEGDDFGSDYDDDEEEEEDADGMDGLRTSQDSGEQYNSLKMESSTLLGEERNKNGEPLGGESTVGSMGSDGLSRNARENCQDDHSVLRPVENLAQWKAIKAKGKPPLKHQRKENLALEQESQSRSNYRHAASRMQEVVVNASLSNWLVTPETSQLKAQPISSITDVESTCSWRNREDTPVLDMASL